MSARYVKVMVVTVGLVGLTVLLSVVSLRQDEPISEPSALLDGSATIPFSGAEDTASLPPENDKGPVSDMSDGPVAPVILPPLPDAAARLTKKPFGLLVSPGRSPVSPERFSGYHTGVDLEVFDDEQEADIPVSAVCSGPLLLKRRASGYGGVVVQGCDVADQEVTVVYGHLALSSIGVGVGETVPAGGVIGRLGRGFSEETDGERKHLHLSIHLGTDIELRGYVPDESSLSKWLDPAELGGWR